MMLLMMMMLMIMMMMMMMMLMMLMTMRTMMTLMMMMTMMMNRGKVVSVSSSRFVSINARGGFLRHHQFIPRIFDLGEYRRSFPNLKKKGASF